MPSTVVEIQTLSGTSLAVGSAGPRTVTIDRTKEAGGRGLGFNGGELLLLAIGGCFSNDVFREAARCGIEVHRVQVRVEAEWGGDPVRTQSVLFLTTVEADATEEQIKELIQRTDRVAEIPTRSGWVQK